MEGLDEEVLFVMFLHYSQTSSSHSACLQEESGLTRHRRMPFVLYGEDVRWARNGPSPSRRSARTPECSSNHPETCPLPDTLPP